MVSARADAAARVPSLDSSSLPPAPGEQVQVAADKDQGVELLRAQRDACGGGGRRGVVDWARRRRRLRVTTSTASPLTAARASRQNLEEEHDKGEQVRAVPGEAKHVHGGRGGGGGDEQRHPRGAARPRAAAAARRARAMGAPIGGAPRAAAGRAAAGPANGAPIGGGGPGTGAQLWRGREEDSATPLFSHKYATICTSLRARPHRS